MKTSMTNSPAKKLGSGPGPKASSVSSRPAKPQRTNRVSTSQLVRRPWGELLAQDDLDLIDNLVTLPDSEINLRDIPETGGNTFKNRSGIVSSGLFRPYKQQVTLRIDGDILAWAKRDGAGYQSRLNAALRAAMMQDLATKRDGK